MARHIFALSCRYSRRLAPGLYIHDTMLRPGRKTVVASCYSVNDPLSSELRNCQARFWCKWVGTKFMGCEQESSPPLARSSSGLWFSNSVKLESSIFLIFPAT